MSQIKREGREIYFSSDNRLLATFASIEDAGFAERIVDMWNASENMKLDDVLEAIRKLPKTL